MMWRARKKHFGYRAELIPLEPRTSQRRGIFIGDSIRPASEEEWGGEARRRGTVTY